MPKNLAAEEHVRAARAKAAFLRPYFAHAFYALIPVEAPACPTMAVDKYGRLYFNPEWVLAHDVDEIATVCLHEIGHVLRRHHERAHALGVTEATHMIANVAMDCELNDDIADEVKGRKDIRALPGGAMYPSTFGFEDGKLWEVYYAQLLDEAEKHADKLRDDDEPPVSASPSQSPSPSSRGASGDSERKGGGGGGSQRDSKSNKSQGDNKGRGGSAPKDRKYKCGSGATGVPQPWEEPSPGAGGREGIEDADWKDIERRVASAIREEHQKGRGTVPGTWVEWSDAILRPQHIPWDQELSGACRVAINDVAGKVIHNYRRPSRRQQAVPDVAFPAMRRPVPSVAFVGDTSGSMSERALSVVRGVVEDVCLALGAALSFIATDAAAHGVQRAANGRSIEMRGRGGTDMRVGIASALEDVTPKPDVIIVGSDCETPWPDEEPNARVIICAIEATEQSIQACPEWARVIVVNIEGEA